MSRDPARALHCTPPEIEVLRLGLSLVTEDIAALKMVAVPTRVFSPSDDDAHGGRPHYHPAYEERLASTYLKEQRRALMHLDKKLRAKGAP